MDRVPGSLSHLTLIKPSPKPDTPGGKGGLRAELFGDGDGSVQVS